ncbi:hypothetical protein BZM26_36395 [Paraburkholderia strydomiana]|nr:hypothetical protein BZM26_36395 [Paraburkholderia strydomiana]
MASKFALSVSLTEHLCVFIAEQVASGRYGTSSEVVRTALRMLEAQTVRYPTVVDHPPQKSERVPGPTPGVAS